MVYSNSRKIGNLQWLYVRKIDELTLPCAPLTKIAGGSYPRNRCVARGGDDVCDGSLSPAERLKERRFGDFDELIDGGRLTESLTRLSNEVMININEFLAVEIQVLRV